MKNIKIMTLVLMITMLGLISCSSSKKVNSNSGALFCQSNAGTFELYLEPFGSSSDLYSLFVLPIQVFRDGDIVSIGLVTPNGNSVGAQVLQHDVTLSANREITLGPISSADLDNFDSIAIVPYQPGTAFLATQNAEYEIFCDLPIPGDSIN